MKCNRCGRSLTEAERYVYQDKIFCEDCLMNVGLSIKECDPWSSYVDTRTRERAGLKGAEGLSETEKKIYEYVKSKGKVTRQEVMASLNLSESELAIKLIPLFHSELVKERSEGDSFYLIPIN